MRILVLVAIFLSVGFYLKVPGDENNDIIFMKEQASPDINQAINQRKQPQDEFTFMVPETGLSTYIGKNVSSIKTSFGEPVRIDPSSFGYDWWIYHDNKNYMQIGVENEKIVTLYAIGDKVKIAPFKIGQSIEEIFSQVSINPDVNLEYDGTSYRFEMSEEDINTRPIVKMGDIYVQLNIDKFTGLLSSIRYFDRRSLIMQRPYELVYLGQLLETTIKEEEWGEIEAGSRRQIFELTNIIRSNFKLNNLKWDEDTAEVAYLHSKDMSETNTFSHTSEQFGDLTDRLIKGNIPFDLAGENIAANFLDAPSVMHGWLNSNGHRNSLLSDKFTHIGVGVYKKYYTQNFVQKPGE